MMQHGKTGRLVRSAKTNELIQSAAPPTRQSDEALESFHGLLWAALLHFPRKAIGYHHEKSHIRASGCWLCAALVLSVALLGMLGATWFLPLPGEVGPGLRHWTFAHLGIRPPIAEFFPNPSLSPIFEVVDPATGKRRAAVQPMICHTGEQIAISFELKERGNVLLFGWDGIAAYHLSRSPLETVSRGIGNYDDIVQLAPIPNEEPLQETIYVIWSALPFDYETFVKPKLLHGPGGNRGGSAVGQRLPLDDGLEQKSFACEHVNSPDASATINR